MGTRMKMDGEFTGFVGEIGLNIPMGIEEKEEDLLERIYELWREGRSTRVSDLAILTGLKTRELNSLVKRMVQHGYLFEPGADKTLVLTTFGKAQGAECISRHRLITQFLELVSGKEEEEAQEEACRIEHMLSKETIEGINNFLRFGDVYDRVFHDVDLCGISSLEDGAFEVCFDFYYPERRAPRILADEGERFESEGEIRVKKGSSHVYLMERDKDLKNQHFWYLYNDRWIKAERKKGCVILPTEYFTFVKSTTLPQIEGTILVAITKEDTTPIVLDCRELNVHIW